MKQLVVEGWRASSHSYALVNQHQLLQLARDPRFSLFHLDVPFCQREWARVDAGLGPEATNVLQSLPPPPGHRVDVIYRISWPLRIYAGSAGRTLVFGTCERGKFPPSCLVGPDGTEQGADLRAVEIVTPSRWSKEGFIALGFQAERIHIVPHGVEALDSTGPLDRRQVRAAFDIPQDAFLFLNIGAMTWNKGIDLLLAAFARHRLRNENAMLLLKGSDALYGNFVGSSMEGARRLCADVTDPRVVASIRYVPQNLTRADIAGLYRASDVYISPYRAEGFNMPVLEALGAGLPAIVTAGGPTEEFCPAHSCLRIEATRDSDVHGYYLEPKLESIIECMQKLTDGAASYREGAREDQRAIVQRYSWRSVTQTLADLLSGQEPA
jgi:glycosyltransferase involved in cell wall biosynthesis